LIGSDEMQDVYGIYSSAIDPFKTKEKQLRGLSPVPDGEPDIHNT
jgi:hypothetical protein